MTASELATLLKAKRNGRGKWVARCPAHDERTASLHITDMGASMRLKCFGCGAGGLQVMKALELRSKDLFVDSGKYDLTPAMKAKFKDEWRLEHLDSMVLVFIANAYFFEPERKDYWLRGERVINREIKQIRDRLYPEEKAAREHREKFDRFIEKYGWDRLWFEFLKSEKGRNLDMQYASEGPHNFPIGYALPIGPSQWPWERIYA
jgi:hypothetical protein